MLQTTLPSAEWIIAFGTAVATVVGAFVVKKHTKSSSVPVEQTTVHRILEEVREIRKDIEIIKGTNVECTTAATLIEKRVEDLWHHVTK